MSLAQHRNKIIGVGFVILCSIITSALLLILPFIFLGNEWLQDLRSRLLSKEALLLLMFLNLMISYAITDFLSYRGPLTCLGVKINFSAIKLKYGDASQGFISDEIIPLKSRFLLVYPVSILIIFIMILLNISQ